MQDLKRKYVIFFMCIQQSHLQNLSAVYTKSDSGKAWQAIVTHPFGYCAQLSMWSLCSIIQLVTAQPSIYWLLNHPWGDCSIIHEVTLLNYPCGDCSAIQVVAAQPSMGWLCSTIHVVTLLHVVTAPPSMWWLLHHPCGDYAPCGDFAQPSMWWPSLIIFNSAFESKYSPSVTSTLQQMGHHWPSCASWLNERGVSGIQENMSASSVNWHSKMKSIHFSLLKRQSFSVICLVVWSRYRWIPTFPR